MKNNKIILLIFMFALFIFTSCEEEVEAPGTNYVSFENNRTLEVEADGTSTFEVMVYSANIVDSDRTFNIMLSPDSTLDPSTYTLPSTVTIPGSTNVGKIDISITDVDLTLANSESIILNLQGGDGLFLGDGITLSVLEECLFNKVNLNITLDDWPEELYWAIEDAEGNVVIENGPYASYANAYAGLSGSIETTLCVESGTYQFIVSDDYGDGAGAIELITSTGTVLFSSDGSYGSGSSATFTLP